MDENKYFELITKRLSGNMSGDDKELLETWLNESLENMNLFKELKKIWELSGKYESDFEPDVNTAIERFKTRVASSRPGKIFQLKSIFKVAAAVILIALAVVSVKLIIDSKENGSVTRFNSSSSAKAEFTLPDSSRVWLNKSSEISYKGDFSDRIVNLKGEAYFEVKKAGGKPFTIFTGTSKTIVLGTSFVIKDIQGSEEVEVVVMTGRVAFSGISDDDSKKVILNPGESGVYNEQKNTITISKNDDMNLLAWKTNVLSFRNTPVKDVISALNRYFNKKIHISDAFPGDCTLTSTFDNQSLEDVLVELKILWNIEYSRNGDEIVISKGGC